MDQGVFEISSLIEHFDKQLIVFILNVHMNNIHDKAIKVMTDSL